MGGGQWTNVVVDLSAQNNSGTLTLLPGQAAGSTIALAGPTTITFNCAGSITLTGNTNPAALQITVAGNNGPAPRAQVVTAGVAQTVSAATPQIANGTGYEFTAWTGPVANVSNASTTVTATTNTTVTANFRVLCYVLTVNVSPSNGGTVTRNPASGVTTGVLSNCYAPGTTVTLTGNAGTGFGAPSWSGATPGSGSTATVVMDQPRTVNVTFSQVANPNANDPVFVVALREPEGIC